LNDAQIVRYYRDLAAALPGVPIIVYENSRAFRGSLSLEVYRGLAEIPEIVAVRQIGGAQTDAAIEALGDRIRFMPNDKNWFPAAQRFPDRARACWSGNVACGPRPFVALSRAIAARDWAAAQTIHEQIVWASETMYPAGHHDDAFSDYSIQLARARFAAAGFIDPGPSRPPYIGVPDAYTGGAAEVGRRFRELHERYG
jgi:4-(2-carboxyphenyl)-2-oxobut-3-enoate aldolase